MRRSPETRFVLDHLGKPAIRSGELDPWRDDLRRLAALPNVWCKVSGLKSKKSFDGIVKRLQSASAVEKTKDGRYRAR